MRLYLVRHGESIAQSKNLVCGQMDSELTSLGRMQAEKLCEQFKLRNELWDHVYVSPLIRAVDTANISLSYSEKLKNKIVQVENIKELNTGAYSSQTFAWLAENDLKLLNMNINNETDFPEGESLSHMHARVSKWFEENVMKDENKEKKILVISHTGSISSIFHYLFGIGLEKYHPIDLDNCNPVILDVRFYEDLRIPRIISINGYI